jgi:hypothetical protein
VNSQDFIRQFARNDQAVYVDLGNHDCGISEEKIYVRDKLANAVSELGRSGLRVSSKTRVGTSYYLAAIGLLILAFYFSVFFMRDALGDDIWVLVLLGVYVSPFVMRRFTSGFRIVGFYFALCTVFALTVGSWKDNELGSGVLVFFAVGVLPYVASRVFYRIWTEASLVLSAQDGEMTFTCPAEKLPGLLRALEGAETGPGPETGVST